jgi:capsular exopolysaccharide synthesis family protein
MGKKKISPINEDFDFKLFVTIAKKNLLWFLLFILVSVFSALLILRYTAPIYESSSIIKIVDEDNAESILGVNIDQRRNSDYNNIAGNIEIIKSRIIVDRAISNLPLDVSYYAKGAVLINELYRQSPFSLEYAIKDSSILDVSIQVDFKDSKTIILNYFSPLKKKKLTFTFPAYKWVQLPEADLKISIENFAQIEELQKEISKDAYFFKINRVSTIAEAVIRDLSISIINVDAKTIQIKLKEKNNFKGSDVVNSLAKEFNKYDVERKSEVANKILDFIDNTIASINIELSNSEVSLENFKKRNRIISPEQAINTISDRLNELQDQYYAIEHEIRLFDGIKKDLKDNNDVSKFILSISGASKDNQIIGQLEKLIVLSDQLEQVRMQATDNSELARSLVLRIRNQKTILQETITNEENQLINRKKEIGSLLNEADNNIGKIPGQQAEYGRLQRLFTINEKFYSMLLEKKAEYSITRAGYVPKHVILQQAKYNSAPVSPNRPLIMSTCLMIGFLASFILIVWRYLIYNEINALEEIGQYTDAALLGIVPKYKREIPVSQLLVDKNPKSIISEAFRSIRTNLQFIANEDQPKLIAVTSTISGEGKTFNAINLAGVIAFSGKKVILLDFDMRKPKIHLGFNVENDRGISTLLIGKDKPEDCIIHSSLANLDFITAGPTPPNPAELIINARMDALIEHLKKSYDIIIIDLPPVGIVRDGIPVMQKADYPLYILRANYSKKMFIIQLNKLMEESKIKNLSVILNGIEMSRLKYGYGYGYSYGYGYGYGYSYGYGYYEEDQEPPTLLSRFRKLFIRG